MNTKQLTEEITQGKYDNLLLDIYVDEGRLDYQKSRYISAIRAYEQYFGENDICIYSAPGRSEIGGNHTDHQHGKVLAASINLDAIAIVNKTDENIVRIKSEGYELLDISLDDLSLVEDEKGTTTALVKGVLSACKERGYYLGGFQAYITSDVLIGAGLSSSAAYETIIGTIVSGLFNDGAISPVEIAIIGQYAENVYFGKPCGLMDQMACSVGNMVYIDFKNPKEPVVEKIAIDLSKYGYSLCITDTKGSHVDLTDDYAAIPYEMKKIAAYFDKEVLCDVTEANLIDNLVKLREIAGDRAVLRALHFVCENERVMQEVEALDKEDIASFLKLVKESGDSSYKYLQNIYSNKDVKHQSVSLALAMSELVLKENGVSRVHGGGFAGTIQAFVKDDFVEEYRRQMNDIFGKDACNVLKIRRYGGMRVL